MVVYRQATSLIPCHHLVRNCFLSHYSLVGNRSFTLVPFFQLLSSWKTEVARFSRTGFQLVRTFPHWFPTVWANIVNNASSRAALPHWFPTSCCALVSHYHTGSTLEAPSKAMRRKSSHQFAVSHWWISISHYILVGKSDVSWKPPISH